MFGSNIKVHFAGADNSMPHYIAANLAGVEYTLFTCYPFIKGKKLTDNFDMRNSNIFVPKLLENNRKHIIMDSGLFTLMFGADKHKKQTKQTLEVWQDKTAKLVEQNNLQCTVVEIDCQKLLGASEAWYFRERMKKLMPKNRHINVFHLEDGMKGLDRLIEYSDYIAVSVPELRIHKGKTYKKDVCKLTHYIKNKKPSIDIHLLGCTEKGLLKQNSFCTSSDSTSWLSANRYGRVGASKYHVNQIKSSFRKSITPQIIDCFNKYGMATKDSAIKHTQDAALSAMICRKNYIEWCGNQN